MTAATQGQASLQYEIDRIREARKPLTIAQLNEAARDAQIDFCMDKESSFEVAFARRIEEAHGIKEAA